MTACRFRDNLPTMLLAVDIGNTRTKFGIFDGETLLTKFSIPTLKNATRVDIRSAVAGSIAYPISSAIICSVVPEIDAEFREFISDEFAVRGAFVTNELDLGLKINYQPRSAAGTDRLVNAFAAAEKYGVPCIVCSFGTAATIDFVNDQRELVGGLIAPGMQTMATALHLNASRLPEVTIDRPDSVLQTSTEGSIRSGVFYGFLGMAESLVNRVKSQIRGDVKVVATGGLALLIAENTTVVDHVDENLLLDGLRIISERQIT